MGNLRSISLICSIITLFSFSSAAQTTDLIISEYAEGSSHNKYIEIYNGTGADVDLSIYSVKIAVNGANFNTTEILSGILVDGDVYIIAHDNASSTILALADITNKTVTNFNGDDAVGLFKNDVLIDIIGEEGTDPGSGWEVAGYGNATLEHTMVRKSTVCSPTTDWTASAGTSTTDSEWTVLSEDDWTNIGSHTSTCGGVPVPINAIWLILLFASSAIVIKKLVK